MRVLLPSAACAIFLALPLAAQTADPAQTLLAGAQQSILETPETPPFHLHATFETYDFLGVSTGTGTFENWWDGKIRARHDTTYRGETESLIRNDGPHITGNVDHPFIENMLVSALYAPVAIHPEDLPKFDLTFQSEQFGGVTLDCITMEPQGSHVASNESSSVIKPPLQASPPEFCFSPATGLLRAARRGYHFTIAYNSILPLGPKRIAHEITITQDHRIRATLHLNYIKRWEPDDATFTPPPEARNPLAPTHDLPPETHAVPGKLVKRVEPVYPEEARQRRIEGFVGLSMTISKEGKPMDIEVTASDDPVLSAAAVQAVEQWVYEPYTVNGEPEPIHTTIKVNFNFKR